MHTVKDILNYGIFDPKKFIKGFKKEPTNRALTLYVLVLTIATLIQFYLAQMFPGSYYANGMQGLLISDILVTIPANFVLLIIFAGISHIFLKLFQSKATYDRALVVVAMASIPSTILSLLPYIGIIISIIYSFGIGIFGFKYTHKVTTGQAITAILAPFVLMILVLFIFYVGIFAAAL